MKKALKIIGGIVVAIVAIASIVRIIMLIKKYSLIEVLAGIGKLGNDGVDVVEISKNGTKFLATGNQDGIDAIKEYLDTVGYKYIGQFGSSNLYEYDGVEIVIKRSSLFGKYYLFEVFNERYFQETSEYLAI